MAVRIASLVVPWHGFKVKADRISAVGFSPVAVAYGLGERPPLPVGLISRHVPLK